MSLIIASQFEDSFNAELREHPLRPTVIGVPEDRPWDVANDADVILVRPSSAWRESRDRERPAAWPGRLQWVYSGSVGIDVYPRWLLDAPLVSCGRGVASEEIADYVIAAIYAQAKDLTRAQVSAPDQWRFSATGRIVGSTIGIIGFGSIGAAVARRAVALGARVTAARRRKLPADVAGVELLDDIAAVVASADHLVLAVPSTPETRNLIDAHLLAHAKPAAHIINVARGAVLDQAALIDALDAGRIAFATLDVTEPEPLPAGHPLWTHPLVRLTPHISSNYTVVRANMYDRVAVSLDRFAKGLPPADLVDATAGY